MRVHVHSPGRAGPRAWPSAPGDARFIALRPDVPARDAASELARVGLGDGAEAVFAHSYLAIPAALAVREPSVALVLVEPAFYDIARGHPDIESHISTVERARLQLAAGDLWGYWTAIRPLMFGGPAQEVTWEEEAHSPLGARLTSRAPQRAAHPGCDRRLERRVRSDRRAARRCRRLTRRAPGTWSPRSGSPTICRDRVRVP